jgi:anti-sigma B factor antagonist
MKMDVLIGEEGGALVCTLRGRLDTPASQEVMKAVQPLLEQADREIILDCRDLEYISSSGLRILLMLRKETGRKGGRLVIRGIREAIRQVFLMTGFYNLFEIREA